LEKLIIAVLIAVFVHLLGLMTVNREAVVDYQKEFYELRVAAYLDLLREARAANNKLAVYWSREQLSSWSEKLSRVLQNEHLASIGMGSGRNFGWGDKSEAVRALISVDSTMTVNIDYFSTEVIQAVDGYFERVFPDLEADANYRINKYRAQEKGETVPASPVDEEKAAKTAHEAFGVLEELIRHKLAVDGIVLG
jgi:hypothetical protein